MIGVLTCHWVLPGNFDEARRVLDGNGLAQSKAFGFVWRQTLISRKDQDKIVTLVAWDDEKVYDLWRASAERVVAMAGAERLWSMPPESERFTIVNRHH